MDAELQTYPDPYGVPGRTRIAERVLAAARAILIRHGPMSPVHPMPLAWARFIVEANT